MPVKPRALTAGLIAVLLVVLAFAVVSCGSGATTTTAGPATTAAPSTTAPPSTEGPTTTAAQTTTSAAATTTSAGATDPAALYAQYCVDCHQAVPVTSLAETQEIIKSGKDTMPGYASTLTAEQIAALSAWAANGGK